MSFIQAVLCLLLGFSSLNLALECRDSSVSVAISRSVDSSGTVSYNTATHSSIGTEECASGEVCGYTSRSAVMNVVGSTRTSSFSSASARCISTSACSLLTPVDSSSGCRTTSVDFTRYYPRSCNISRKYDAVEFSVRKRYVAGCCNEALCPATSVSDFTQCTSDEALNAYIKALHICWNTVKFKWRVFFFCNSTGISAKRYTDTCYRGGKWNRSSTGTACAYRPRCRRVLRAYMTIFGNCACRAAAIRGRSGVLINSLMEDLFDDYCPGIDFSCSAVKDSTTRAIVRRRLHRRKFRLRLNRTLSTANRTSLKAYMLMRLRLTSVDSDSDSDSQSIEFNSVNRRRLLTGMTDMTVDLQYEYDTEYDDYMNDTLCTIGPDIAAMYGTTAQVLDCSSSNEYYSISDNSTDYSGSNERVISYFVIVLVSLMLFIIVNGSVK